MIVDVPSSAQHISTIRCCDMVVGVNGIESSKEERMEILRTTPCPKIVNFLRYGKSVEVSQRLMTSILGLYSDEPLPFVPQPRTHQPLAGQPGSPEDRRSSSVTKPPPTEYKNDLSLENDKMVGGDGGRDGCFGIQRVTIEQSRIQDKDYVLKGLNHLIGNAYRQKGSYISQNGSWDYDISTVGFLFDNYNQNSNEATDKTKATDEGFSYSFSCSVTDSSQWQFHRSSCTGRKVTRLQRSGC